MTLPLHHLRSRYGDIRRAFRAPAPIWAQVRNQVLARIAPPGRVPTGWLTMSLADSTRRSTDLLAALLRDEPVVLPWRGAPALVLFPYGLETS